MKIPPEKIENLAIVLIIILVGTGSFGLGRLSAEKEGMEQPSLIMPASKEGVERQEAYAAEGQTASVKNSGVLSSSSKVVVSKNGTKYHFSWCPGAKTISDENKIWFDSASAAEEAGYTKALNCKSL